MYRLIFSVILAIALASTASLNIQAQEDNCQSNEVLFHSASDNNHQYLVLNVDTLEIETLPNGHLITSMPSWSPDYSRMAFISHMERGFAIYLMNRDGNDLHMLTEVLGVTTPLIWSPNGRYIAFHGQFETFIVAIDTDEVQQVTDDATYYTSPVAWSHDGDEIIVSEHQPGISASLAQIDLKTGEKQVLTEAQEFVYDWYVGQTPEGNILFNSNRLTERTSLHYLDVSSETTTVYTERAAYGVSWTSDQTAFIFMSARSIGHPNVSLQNIYFVDWLSGTISQVTQDWTISHENYLSPALSPDDHRIVFESFAEDDYELFVIDTDGTNLRQLTFNNDHDTSPQWLPCE